MKFMSSGIYKYKIVTILLLVTLSLVGITESSCAAESKLKHAVLMRPDVDSRFWNLLEKIMRATADDLGIKLEAIRIQDDPVRAVQQATRIAAYQDKPDLVVFYVYAGTGPQIIQIFDKAGIKNMVINSGIPERQAKKTGKPREIYSNWIGQILPDDRKIGENLGAYLYKAVKSRNPENKQKVHMIGISGKDNVRPSDLRVEGLRKLSTKAMDLSLDTIQEGEWHTDTSQKVTERLLKRFPETNAIWSVGGEASIGIIQAVENAGLIPGKDIIIASVDWLPEVLSLVQSGKIEGTIGGHSAEGAWALILAYDYFNGYDFAEKYGVELNSDTPILDMSNINQYEQQIKEFDWNQIDFKKFTKTDNPKIQSYNFNMLVLIDSLKENQN